MRIYLDDNRADQKLAAMLRKAGHLVVRPAEVGLTGASDPRHLEYAIRESLVVLTSDRDDYRDLHYLVLTSGGAHPGILVVHYENDATRDMKPKHIVAAVAKLEKAGIPLASQLIILNHWR
jgi:predicted nuclease of predicted toxin-antitoxin system